MLSGSNINPFDSQETKPYQNDPRISTMTDLVNAYQREDIHDYERTKAVVKLVAPYTRFTLAFISKQLKISLPEVQDIVGFLIVDKSLRGKINQKTGTVEIESSTDMERVQAIEEWSASIGSLWATVLNEGEGFKSEDGGSQYTQSGGGPMVQQSLNGIGAKHARVPKGKGPGRALGIGSKG